MRHYTFIIILIASILFNTSNGWGYFRPTPTVEPEIYTSMGWDLLPTGMLIVGYDLDRNGNPDYYTLRVVVRSFISGESVATVAQNNRNRLVFYVDYDTTHFFYITVVEPLFYAIDANEDGHWDLIFKDVSQDGINGNEVFYDSPSGMYALK